MARRARNRRGDVASRLAVLNGVALRAFRYSGARAAPSANPFWASYSLGRGVVGLVRLGLRRGGAR